MTCWPRTITPNCSRTRTTNPASTCYAFPVPAASCGRSAFTGSHSGAVGLPSCFPAAIACAWRCRQPGDDRFRPTSMTGGGPGEKLLRPGMGGGVRWPFAITRADVRMRPRARTLLRPRQSLRRRRPGKIVCANPRIWTGAAQNPGASPNPGNVSVYSSAGVSLMRPPSVERTGASDRTQQALQKKCIKRGVFQQRLIVVRSPVRAACADAGKCDAAKSGPRQGRG